MRPTSTSGTRRKTDAPGRAATDRERLGAACRDLGLRPTATQLDLLLRYAALIAEWNGRLNLVSRRDTGRIVDYHIVDSVAVAGLVPPGARLADIGTGAGLPGVPLAIVRPDLAVTLVESSARKCLFLRRATAGLDLPGIRVISERAEALPPLGVDVLTSRLTAPAGTLLRQSRHHLGPTGRLVLYKSPAGAPLDPRLLARHRLRSAFSVDVILPLTGTNRRFVVLAPA